MKPFRFTLQALCTLRERQEQLALQVYAKALQGREAARAKVAAIQQELEAGWEDFRRQARGDCLASELARMRGYCQSVEQRKQVFEHAAKVAQNKADQAFTSLLATRQARAVVDKFHENQKRVHERERRRHDQHALDDMANHQDALLAVASVSRDALWR